MPDPEEVLTNVLADMFEPWEPASPRTIAFSKMLRAKLDERGIRLARVVPEDRPDRCPNCWALNRWQRGGALDAPSGRCQHTWHGEPAGVPALDDDTRREVPEVLLTFAKWADWYLEDGCRRDHHGYCQAHGLDKDCPVGPMREWLAAYLGGTE